MPFCICYAGGGVVPLPEGVDEEGARRSYEAIWLLVDGFEEPAPIPMKLCEVDGEGREIRVLEYESSKAPVV